MNNRHASGLKLTALGLVGFHFLTVVLHSVAHEVLNVKASPAQLAFIIPVIILGPVAAGFTLLKFEKAGAAVLLVSMLGSLAFGVYYHFVADTIDHVAHVARLRPEFWSSMFRVTSYLLAASEAAGAAVAGALLAAGRQPLKHYATRTDF
ncbi:MAG TPA: hypothetical protein VGX48_25720 [Pyrinomonadaceae bacterium]|jgi:hypothetical protein|nr:hypothetical protein [Pyrinomonadaceae bacterium]